MKAFSTKIRNLLLRLVDSKVSIPSFLWVFSSAAIATYIVFHHDIFQQTLLGKYLPYNIVAWGIILIIGDITTFAGMILRLGNVPLVRIGSFISFMSWLFANISLFHGPGAWFTFVVLTGQYMLMYAYLYLAGSLGFFKRTKNE